MHPEGTARRSILDGGDFAASLTRYLTEPACKQLAVELVAATDPPP
jgi:hypothetical protein